MIAATVERVVAARSSRVGAALVTRRGIVGLEYRMKRKRKEEDHRGASIRTGMLQTTG